MNTHHLKLALDSLGVSPDRYNLDGGPPSRSEGLVLSQDGSTWLVRHFERGSWYSMGSFPSEADACVFLLDLAKDPFYKT